MPRRTETGEAPVWQGAKSEFIGHERAMSNAARRDASPVECSGTFSSGSFGGSVGDRDDYILFSGGAPGAEMAFGENAERLGIEEVNFAFEGWTLISGAGVECTGGQEYGYALFPWIVEGTIGDMTFEDGVTNFVVNARTRSNSPWGTGPYMVDYSDNPAGSTTEIPLLTPIASDQHKRFFLTRLAPPDAACGCSELADLTP